MYNLLKGKKGIIFGALDEKSIAWHIAERCYEEGAEFTLSNTPVALRMGTLDKLAQKCNSEIIPADATSVEDITNVFQKSMDKFGGKVDFVLHSIGMSVNVRKNITYDQLNYEFYKKTLDISAWSFHKILNVAYQMDAIKEWGSVVALTYIAAQKIFCSYSDMADAKSLLESIARSFGYVFGRDRKVRINTVSQSPVMTTAGSGVKGIDTLYDFADKISPLGNATADDCAAYVVSLFSDLTRRITMQNLFNDGGFSTMGMSEAAMQVYEKGMEN